MVAAVALIVLVLGVGAAGLLLSSIAQTRSSVLRVIDTVGPPKDHLLAAERANNRSQATLAAAAGAIGEERTRLLSAAIIQSQTLTSEWNKYRSLAIGLPGESALQDRYDADQELAQATTSAALVPILNSTVAGMLPQSEVETHEAVQRDLVQIHTLYRAADRESLAEIEGHTARLELLIALGASLALIVVVAGTIVGWRVARRSMAERTERAAVSVLADFETRLRRALEFVNDDVAAFAVADRALIEMLPESRPSLLIADSSRARLTPIGLDATCGVSSPDECPALRSSSTLRFPDSEALDACPKLSANATERCSASCVPVTIAGRGAAIVHLVGRPGIAPDNHGVPDLVARSVGERVTLLQAFAAFQLQAERDPLTGLLNRRSLETATQRLLDSGRPYAVAFGDLDHFKQLNDTHGHDAGDRALRAFSQTLQESLRPEDVTCRWGGEEFVIVLPDCDAATAIEAMDRVRTNLALGSINGQTAGFTVSFGVAHSTDADSFEQVIDRADAALSIAKKTGRNRVVRYEATVSPSDVLT